MDVASGSRAHDHDDAERCVGGRGRPAELRRGGRGVLRFDRRLPLRLAELYHQTSVGDVVELHVEGPRPKDAPSLDDLIIGGGFVRRSDGAVERVLSLPDTVAPGMRVLTCGLNPAIYAAERGVGFARGSNRFWRAAVAAGLVDRERDPMDALITHGMGMTDLCKRATVASSDVTREEYVEGAARVERLVRWLRPRVIVFVGLEGWRAAVDRTAAPGLQARRFGGRPAYVMPSTSGLNAHARLEDLVAHLRTAIDRVRG